ncbi:MAG: DUF4115 domain-containing protein [Ignavibacteriales bacterium]|nr:MAG: DUF4115 domain-containing protein [Ignavibacteriales bacterium]
MLDKFAEELRNSRQSADISLQQMAAKTRIDIKFLEALDAGDFSFLPELYVKAFLKEYAAVVGLDAGETIRKYELAKQGIDFDAAVQPVKEEQQAVKNTITLEQPKPKPVQSFDGVQKPESPADKEKQARQKNIILLSVVGGAVVILILLFLFVFRSSDEIIVPEKPFEEVIDSGTSRYEEVPTGTVLDSAGNLITAQDSLSLQILTTDTSWVKIIYDDKRAEDFILFPNSQKNLVTGNNFKITLGNAGGIQFKLNNELLNFSGKAKTVAHVMIDSEGLKTLSSPPELD